ncbi:SIMPL domain-containing protein [Bacillus sp. SG-1]|uniref:SIMPL domain-containing protein n=1 Tax=Bacillus sp. SG-1 TaxID=161544 RepID=UPI0002D538F1|nr:SIMPL domain-containing protein [Bacillus sp. SG-1]
MYYQQPYRNQAEKKSNRTVTVTGEKTIDVQPDLAIAQIGAVTSDKELTKAQRKNNEVSTAVLNSFKQNGIAEKDIQTSTYQIYPQYDYIDGKQVFKGYEVRQVFSVKIREIDKIGEVIDDAVGNGANIIERVEFAIAEPQIHYQKALSKAYEDALKKAQVLARSAGTTLNPMPLEINEDSSIPMIPRPAKAYVLAAESTAPLQPGEVGILARLTVKYKLMQ